MFPTSDEIQSMIDRLDYDDKGALQAITDGCLNGAAGVEVLTEHVGTSTAPDASQTVVNAWLIHFEAFGWHDFDSIM